MGNSESSDVTIEKEEDNYILSGDGVRLSPALVNQMITQQENKPMQKETGKLQNNLAKVQDQLDQEKHVVEETLQLLEEREKQMNKLNETWKQRLQDERDKYQNYNGIAVEEFEKAAENVEKKFMKPKLRPICEGLQEDMIKCYNENPQTTLNCSKQVFEFSKCVEQAKEAILNKKEKQSDS